MDSEQFFEKTVDDTLCRLRELIIVKGAEYRRNNNPYHNFDEGARIKNKSSLEVLDGFRLKHEISQQDLRNDLYSGQVINEAVVCEKWDDSLVYTIIEKAMILQKLKDIKGNLKL